MAATRFWYHDSEYGYHCDCGSDYVASPDCRCEDCRRLFGDRREPLEQCPECGEPFAEGEGSLKARQGEG